MELVLDRLSHSFGPLAVLDDITLHAASGEIVVLLGPSGCGKSTLLRIAGGLEVPTSGIVSAGGSAGGVRFVFQDPTLLPWRTAAGNVALPLEHLGLDRAARARRVEAALRRVGMADFAGHYPGTLSGGMRQRIGIARALVADPAVLLMDEPLAALDAQTRDLLIADLCRLWGESRYTCLYVTHSPAEAARIGHRVVVLSPRPARIREILRIDLPLDQRSDAHPVVAAAREHIWSLVRAPHMSGFAHAG